jgi:BlaI family penicillinase repressor
MYRSTREDWIDAEESQSPDPFRATNYARALGRWRRNVQKVSQGLTGEPQLAYTTVQTTLNVLQRKGKVKRKLVGRAYEYSPIVSQETADSHAIKDVLQKVFRGSVDNLLLSLVRSKQLDPQKLAELQAKLQASESAEEERE